MRARAGLPVTAALEAIIDKPESDALQSCVPFRCAAPLRSPDIRAAAAAGKPSACALIAPSAE
ncbi:hypothetical protein [Paraburkholderia sp. BL6669N2]|uniref:hypothetical protein n=1 Tax=Paraburkholderia sp. BL6669N2 TaxID=1938807 RepID=UPI000E25175D|nr:hypothetical protein [Paraburkholderia sp. BL6669N2]